MEDSSRRMNLGHYIDSDMHEVNRSPGPCRRRKGTGEYFRRYRGIRHCLIIGHIIDVDELTEYGASEASTPSLGYKDHPAFSSTHPPITHHPLPLFEQSSGKARQGKARQSRILHELHRSAASAESAYAAYAAYPTSLHLLHRPEERRLPIYHQAAPWAPMTSP